MWKHDFQINFRAVRQFVREAENQFPLVGNTGARGVAIISEFLDFVTNSRRRNVREKNGQGNETSFSFAIPFNDKRFAIIGHAIQNFAGTLAQFCHRKQAEIRLCV